MTLNPSKLKSLFRFALVAIFLLSFSKQSFAQTKSFFDGPYIGIDAGTVTKGTDDGPEYYNGTPDGYGNKNKLQGNVFGLHLGYNFPLIKGFYISPLLEYKKGQDLRSGWNPQQPYNGEPQNVCNWCTKTKMNHSTSLLGKVGFLFDEKNSLNVVGGWSDINLTRGIYDYNVNITQFTVNKIHTVPTYGFGYERVYNEKLSFVIDYRYLKTKTLNSESYSAPDEYFSYRQETVTLGINYKF